MTKPGKDDEDAALWDKIAGSASPLKGRDKLPPRDKSHAAPAKRATPEPQPQAVAPPPAPAAKRAPPARATPLDRQTSRQLEKGRLEVEARLDLHGMRQRDAHAQLRRFLKTAQGRGLRHVLVITGKGADQAASTSFYEEEERGILRQAVPLWLSEPGLASLVVSYSPAPRRLGGDGALYVRVRALKRGERQ
jgi:DNA-nicking Smr family endonuclease